MSWIKVSHHHLVGKMNSLIMLAWKYEEISIDFISCLPNISKNYDSTSRSFK
jgi:hypothetical protein